jgi:hypothetical protein
VSRLRCPDCGQPGTPILYGLPVPEALEAAAEGLLVLAGCLEPTEPQHWHCPAGHRWASTDEQWEAAITAAMHVRPPCSSCGSPSIRLILPDEAEYFTAELDSGDAVVSPGLAVQYWYSCTSCVRMW